MISITMRKIELTWPTIKPCIFLSRFGKAIVSVIIGFIIISKKQENGNVMVAMQVSYSVTMRDQSLEHSVAVHNSNFLYIIVIFFFIH